MSKETKALETIKQAYMFFQHMPNEFVMRDNEREMFNIIKSALERKEKLENVIRDLFNNHIELVIEDNGNSYYKIKGSKEKEKSFTSKHIAEGVLDLLKEMMK